MRNILKLSSAILYLAFCSPNLSAQKELIEWKFETSGVVYSSPVFKGDTIFIGSLDSCIYAINSKTGEEIWKFKSINSIYSTPALSDSLIFFESGNCLQALHYDGSLAWKTCEGTSDYKSPNDYWDYLRPSATIADTIVYYTGDSQNGGAVFGEHFTNKGSSKVFHSYRPEASVETTPLIYEDKIYFGDWDGVFHAYCLIGDTLIWEYDTKEDHTYAWANSIQTDPVVYQGNILFAGRSCNFYSLGAEDGSVNWMHHSPTDEWLFGGPALEDSIAYMGSSNQRLVQAFNVNNGDVIWQAKLDYRIFGKPLVLADHIIVGTGMETSNKFGSVFAINKITGEVVNRFATTGQVHSSIKEKNGILYFGCADKHIYAIRLNDLINYKRAKTDFVGNDTIKLGLLSPSQLVDTTLYMKNIGQGTDSVNIKITGSEISITPATFKVPPADSVALQLSFDASEFEPGIYAKKMVYTSNNVVLVNSTSRIITFEVEEGSSSFKEIKGGNQTFWTQNYPNPFEKSTTIEFFLSETSEVQLSVYSITGKLVTTLHRGETSKGLYKMDFVPTCPGPQVYFYRLQVDEKTLTKTILKR